MRRLPFTDEKVTWRIAKADMDLLRLQHSNVNDFARELIAAYCRRVRGNGLPVAHIVPPGQNTP